MGQALTRQVNTGQIVQLLESHPLYSKLKRVVVGRLKVAVGMIEGQPQTVTVGSGYELNCLLTDEINRRYGHYVGNDGQLSDGQIVEAVINSYFYSLTGKAMLE